MDVPVNAFKREMLSGRQQIGLWLALANATTAELCAAAGFDWVMIDGEHGPNDVASIMAQLQAVAPYPGGAIVRPPEGDAVTIKRYLDIGAQTLLIPMVDSAEQARDLVAATRFAPEGVRGLATMTRAGRWGRMPTYLARAHEEICLILQIETAAAVEQIEAIAAVEGVDALFIGPADLSASMGFRGQGGHPEVLQTVRRSIERVKATGKPCGIFTLDEALAREYLDMGCDFVAVGADALLLSRSVDALKARFIA